MLIVIKPMPYINDFFITVQLCESRLKRNILEIVGFTYFLLVTGIE